MPGYSIENEKKRKKFIHELATKVQKLQKEYNDLPLEIQKDLYEQFYMVYQAGNVAHLISWLLMKLTDRLFVTLQLKKYKTIGE